MASKIQGHQSNFYVISITFCGRRISAWEKCRDTRYHDCPLYPRLAASSFFSNFDQRKTFSFLKIAVIFHLPDTRVQFANMILGPDRVLSDTLPRVSETLLSRDPGLVTSHVPRLGAQGLPWASLVYSEARALLDTFTQANTSLSSSDFSSWREMIFIRNKILLDSILFQNAVQLC